MSIAASYDHPLTRSEPGRLAKMSSASGEARQMVEPGNLGRTPKVPAAKAGCGSERSNEVSETAQPVVGWRGWRLASRPRNGKYVLLPLAHSGRVWPARRPYRAICEEQGRHHAPDMWGTCGSYSVKDVEWAAYEAKLLNATVVGTV